MNRKAMIVVEIEVPSVGRNYQFRLEEMVKVNTLITEIAEMIGQKEHSPLMGKIDSLVLCSRDKECILNKNQSLSEQGIQNAETLLLV